MPAGPIGQALPERLPTAEAPMSAPVSRRPSGAPSIPDALSLLRALRGRWGVALSLGLAAAVAAGGVAWVVVPRPRYTATAIVEVKAETPNLLPGPEPDRPDLKVFQSAQIALARSRLVLNAVVGRPALSALPTLRAQRDPAEWLADELVSEFPLGPELLRLSLTGDRPEDLARLVNAVAEVYLDEVVSKDYNDRLAASASLKDLLAQYNDKLTRQRARLRETAETVGSDDRQTLALKQQLAVQRLDEENRELLGVRTDLKKMRAELSVLASGGAGDPAAEEERDAAEVEALLDHEPAVERLQTLAQTQAARIERMRRLVRSENDPALREARRALDQTRHDVADARAALRPRIERQLEEQDANRMSPARRRAELEARVKVRDAYETVLRQGVERLEAEAQSFNRKTIDLQWMKDEIAQGEDVARQLGRQIEALNVELKAPRRGRLIEPAEDPRRESQRKRLASVGLAALGAFGCVVLGIGWREFRLRRVDSPEELSHGLGLRLVGTLPALPGPVRGRGRGRSKHAPAPSASATAAAPSWQDLLIESIDAARTVILRDCRTEALRSILVTSAAKGEGKSSLAGHLAISLARTGRRTLLVDFDLRDPSVHRLFDLDRGPGTSDLLRGAADPEDVVHAAADDLDVITAGEADPRAVRALGQDALPELLARMTARYEFVVIDSAPLLPVADSLLISQHVDAVLLSVYREKSRVPTVFAGYQRLAALGVRILGAVVTGMPAAEYGPEYQYDLSRGA